MVVPHIFGLLIYREYQWGATVEELAQTFNVPEAWIRQRIEAVRLCLERQVRIELRPQAAPRRARVRKSAR